MPLCIAYEDALYVDSRLLSHPATLGSVEKGARVFRAPRSPNEWSERETEYLTVVNQACSLPAVLVIQK